MIQGEKVANADDFKIVRQKKGLGMGLVTLRPWRKGEKIIEYIGIKKTNKSVEGDETKYLFEVNSKYTVDGSPRWNIARYINHSCAPNAEADIIKGKIWIKAEKNILAGEEVTYDYGKEYFDEFIKPSGCKCRKCDKKK
jgi:SET domain-containing protein